MYVLVEDCKQNHETEGKTLSFPFFLLLQMEFEAWVLPDSYSWEKIISLTNVYW